MHQKTVDLGHYFNGLGKDFMVRRMEAIKCCRWISSSWTAGSVRRL